MTVKLRWLGYACFEMVLPSGKVLVTDPYIDYSSTAPISCQEVTGADYITLTHGHFDHITDVGTLAHKFGSSVICSRTVAGPLAELFDLNADKLIKVTAGDTVTLDDLRVEVMKGQHVDLRKVMARIYERITGEQPDPEMSFAEISKAVSPRLSRTYNSKLKEMIARIRDAGLEAGEQLNFIFQTGHNLRMCVFSSGPFEHLRQEVIKSRPDVYIGQLGGVDAEEAAEFAALSGADLVIPYHHDSGGRWASRSMAQKMEKHLATRSHAQFLAIEHGRWYELGDGATAV